MKRGLVANCFLVIGRRRMPLCRESTGLLPAYRAAFRGRGFADYASGWGSGLVVEESGEEVGHFLYTATRLIPLDYAD
jgi:hypothetical protein